MHHLKRLIWLSAGHLTLALGIVGIFLPLLPTTPFLLLAAFCYSRGSARFELWLVEHPRFGPAIQDWRRHRAIRPRAKVLSITMISLSIAYVMTQKSIPLGGKLAMLAMTLPSMVFILTRSSGGTPPVGGRGCDTREKSDVGRQKLS